MCLFYCTTDCGSYNLSCGTQSKKKTSDPEQEKGSAWSEKMAAHEKRRTALIRHFHLSFYKGTIGISSLGTYYTFLLVAQPDPLSQLTANNKIFTPRSSRTLVAVAWLLFLLSLGLSTAALLSFSFRYAARSSYHASTADNASVVVPNFYGSQKQETGIRQEETWMTITSGVIFSVILVAFLLSSLAVVAYMPAIGIIGAAFIAVFMLVSLAIWIRQLV